MKTTIIIETTSNFHPFECDSKKCIHCNKIKLEYHDPKTCALCKM